MEFIGKDDAEKYYNHLETLRNLNKFYFEPYLNENIPYKEKEKATIN